MKVGILGVAHMQAESYTKVFANEKVSVVGVYDRNTLRGTQFAKKLAIPFFQSMENILNTDIDTVLICSENSLHYDYTLAAAFHNKHVIIEKPLALKVDDALRMMLTCEEFRVKLLVAHPMRFSKTIIDLKTVFDSGQLGQILALNGTNHGKNPGGWFLNRELSGGGAIIDHMIHLIDLSNWLFHFKIQSIYARKKGNLVSDIEDAGLIHIEFTNGSFMSLDTSWNRPLNYPVWGDAALEIITDRGQLYVDGFGRKAELYHHDSHYDYKLFEKDPDVEMIQTFIRCIDKNEPLPVTGEDALYTVKIANLAYASIQQNRTIYQHEFEEILRTPFYL